MSTGFSLYCTQNPLCKNPNGDPSWPDHARSSVSLKGSIGISNMDALING
jgi:hypothetical protein